MKIHNRILQATAMFLILAFACTVSYAQKLRKEGRHYIAEIEKSFNVQPGGDLVIKDVNGEVIVTTWGKNEVKINEVRKMDVFTKGEAEAVLKDAESAYTKSGNTVSVSGPNVSRSYMNSRFTINVPSKFNVNISTRGGDVNVTKLHGSADLKTSGGDIDLEGIDGVVNAKTSGGDVTVHKTKQQVTVKTSGGDVELIEVDGPVEAKTSGGDIIVRNNKARVKAYTSGGDIEMEDVGAEVEAHTSGGDIEIDGSKGSIEVSTSGGDIEMAHIGGAVAAHTSGGDIEAHQVQGGIQVKTSGGDIDLGHINGFIEAGTSGGDVEAEMTLKDFSKDHHVELKSSGGDLVLKIPAKLPATINAEIYLRNEDRLGEFDIESDFSLEKKVTKDGRDHVIRAKGKINGGGDLINLKTNSGNIDIKKVK